jgi:hypothetical protein
MTKTADRWFTLFLAAVGLSAAVASLALNPTARAFPLCFGILLFVLAVLVFLASLLPEARWLAFVRSRGVLENASDAGGADALRERSADDPVVPWRLVCLGFVSIVAFVVLIAFVNYLIAVPLYVIGRIVLVSKGKILPALIAAGALELLVYLIFEVVL